MLYQDKSFEKFVEGPETYIEDEEEDSTPEEILWKITPKKETDPSLWARTECRKPNDKYQE